MLFRKKRKSGINAAAYIEYHDRGYKIFLLASYIVYYTYRSCALGAANETPDESANIPALDRGSRESDHFIKAPVPAVNRTSHLSARLYSPVIARCINRTLVIHIYTHAAAAVSRFSSHSITRNFISRSSREFVCIFFSRDDRQIEFALRHCYYIYISTTRLERTCARRSSKRGAIIVYGPNRQQREETE